jgi:hypothetical protein
MLAPHKCTMVQTHVGGGRAVMACHTVAAELAGVADVVDQFVHTLHGSSCSSTDSLSNDSGGGGGVHDVLFELELRVGAVGGHHGGYVPGVPASNFGAVERVLMGCTQWDDVSAEVVTCDSFYDAGARLGSVRSSTVMEWAGDRYMMGHPLHVRKQRMSSHELTSTNAAAAATTGGLAARVVTSRETTLHATELPDTVTTTLVRIKKRRRFTHGNWAFDLTRVWCGRTFGEASAACVSKRAPSHEVELELLRPHTYFSDAGGHTPMYGAVTALCKVHDAIAAAGASA